MRKTLCIPLLLSCFVLAGCNGGETEAVTASPEAAPVKASKSNGLKGLGSACEIFTTAEIRDLFGIEEATGLQVSESGATFPACSYEWGENLIVRTVSAGGKEYEISEPAKVMLVVAQGVPAGAFETSTSVYKDAEDVPGIGDMARWGTSMSQLTVLADANLFHINVKASSNREENRTMAMDLSEMLMRKF